MKEEMEKYRCLECGGRQMKRIIVGCSGKEYEVTGVGFHLGPTGKFDPAYCEGFFITKGGGIVHFHNVSHPLPVLLRFDNFLPVSELNPGGGEKLWNL